MSGEQHEVTDGTLVVRTTVSSGGARVISLHGELDLANAKTAEAALESSFGENGTPIVIDMSELEFIDSTGIALLVAALGRGDEGGQVTFVPSSAPAVTRVLELTGLAGRLPLAKA
jgi:anti-anti-sigma factor